MKTPHKGQSIRINAHHPFPEVTGTVIDVAGNIVHFRRPDGDTDLVIWKFKNGVNPWIEFGGVA